MGILSFLGKKVTYEDSNKNIIEILKKELGEEQCTQLLAEAHAMDMIAGSIANTELQTLEINDKDKPVQNTIGELYYLLNIKPNYFDNGTNFFYKLAIKLLLREEALIVIKENKKGKKNLYLADSFTVSEKVMQRKTYKDVIISDNNSNKLTLYKEIPTDEGIHICYKNTKLNKANTLHKNQMNKLLQIAIKEFKRANVAKYIFNTPGDQPTIMDIETKQPITYEKYKEKMTEGLFDEEEAIILLSKMFNISKLETGNKNIEDVDKIQEKIFKTTAMKYKIPYDVYMGIKTEKSEGSDDYVTDAVFPYMNTIEDSLNDSLVGEEAYIKGERIKYNTFCMKHADITKLASSLEKLTGIGFSHNDIRMFLSMPKVHEKWADEHNMTKNIGRVEGGEK